MDKKICKNCQYFHQHYALNKEKIHWVFCGHCTFKKVRSKHPHSKICENFQLGEPDEAAFVSKEFLSKALLQYMTQLELLPEISDSE